MLLPYHGPHDTVAHKDDQHLHKRLQTFGSLVLAFLVAFLGHHDNDNQQDNDNHDGSGHLGDGEVQRFHHLAGFVKQRLASLVHTDNLLLLDAAAHKTIAFIIGMAMMELGGHEDIQVSIIDKDYRQGDGDSMLLARLVEIVKHMPRMGVGDVSDNG